MEEGPFLRVVGTVTFLLFLVIKYNLAAAEKYKNPLNGTCYICYYGLFTQAIEPNYILCFLLNLFVFKGTSFKYLNTELKISR